MPTRPATSKNRTEGSPNRTPTPKHRAPKVEKSNPTFEKSPSGFEVSTPDCPDPGVPMPDRRTARPRSRTRGPPCPGTVHAVAGCAARRVEAGRHVPRAPPPNSRSARQPPHRCFAITQPSTAQGLVNTRPGRRHTSACRAPPHLLPAGGLLQKIRRTANGERAEGTRLPAGFSLTSCLPGACFTSCLPGAVASTAPTASLSRRARQTGRYAQPSPPNARTPAKWHLL